MIVKWSNAVLLLADPEVDGSNPVKTYKKTGSASSVVTKTCNKKKLERHFSLELKSCSTLSIQIPMTSKIAESLNKGFKMNKYYTTYLGGHGLCMLLDSMGF